MDVDITSRERAIPSQLTGSINETYFSGLTDVSDSWVPRKENWEVVV